MKEPDLGTALVYITAIIFMLFVSGIDRKYIILAFVIIAIAAPIVYKNLPEHALNRIQVFLNPGSDPRGAGYNIIQSELAIGSGQIFGMGFLKGKSSIMIHERHGNLKYKYGNRSFWCRGYYVDTAGKNAKRIEAYIKNQLHEDKVNDQMTLRGFEDPFMGSK